MPTPADFLAALTAYLEGNAELTAALAEIYTGDVPPDPTNPYLSLQDYQETLPGESLDDEPVTFTLAVYGASEDQVRAAAAVVKAQVDSPAINPASTRTQLTFSGGTEVMVWRNSSVPRRRRGNRGTSPVWCERIEYQIWISPNQ